MFSRYSEDTEDGSLRQALPRRLALVTVLSAILMLFAFWQSQVTLYDQSDLQHANALKSDCIALFDQIHTQNKKPHDGKATWQPILQEMTLYRNALRQRYPKAVSDTNGTFIDLTRSLANTGTVDWPTIAAFYKQVDAISQDVEMQTRTQLTRVMFIYGIGLTGFAIVLPWGVVLMSRSRRRQNRLMREKAERDAALNRFATLFAGIPSACYSFDPNGRLLLWNHAAEQVFGKAAEDVIGKPVWEVIARPETYSIVQHYLSEITQGKDLNNIEWQYRRPDNHLIELLSTVFPLRDGDDAVIGGISASVDITLRKQMEARTKRILEGARCIVWDAEVTMAPGSDTLEWQSVLWNVDAAQTVLPLDTTERDYIAAWMESRKEDNIRLNATSTEAIRQGRNGYSQEYRCIDRNGVPHWLSEHAQIEYVGPGHWHITGICNDITERRQTEERLDEVLAGAHCILWDAIITDRGDSFYWDTTIWNQETAQQFLPLDTSVDKYEWAFDKSRLPEDHVRVNNYGHGAMLSGQPSYSQEFRCRDRHGNIHWFHEDVVVQAKGPGTWTAIGICREITLRKLAEQRLENVLDKARCILWDATVIWNGERLVWDFTVCNLGTAMEILPLDTRDSNYAYAWSNCRLEEDQAVMDGNSRNALLNGKTGYSQEFRCYDRNGVVHWLREEAQIEALAPNRWQVIGVCTDITSRKEAEERLQALTNELSRSNAALQDFASIASHDLKEPLRKIQTFGNMLVRKLGTLPPDAQGYLDRMLNATIRMQALIDGLLSYSRVTTKASAFVTTDLNKTLRDVQTDLEVRLQETSAQLDIGPLPSVQADAMQMHQLFQNLLGNALKFHRTDVPCQITIQCVEEAGKYRITVADNGIGFSPKDGERIFEVFERLEGSDREGTGIGLAICRKIVERHGGTITAMGRPGEGATFTIFLNVPPYATGTR